MYESENNKKLILMDNDRNYDQEVRKMKRQESMGSLDGDSALLPVEGGAGSSIFNEYIEKARQDIKLESRGSSRRIDSLDNQAIRM
jgi:hypothetical protein